MFKLHWKEGRPYLPSYVADRLHTINKKRWRGLAPKTVMVVGLEMSAAAPPILFFMVRPNTWDMMVLIADKDGKISVENQKPMEYQVYPSEDFNKTLRDLEDKPR